jgi:regulator of protease activity HflC (stomatin/prohibitin superfamily)
MTTIGWVILVILLIPALGLLLWVVLSASFVRVPTGRYALLLVRGRPTDTTLPPGLHFLFALRRRMIVTYPSVELSYRAGGAPGPADQPGLDCVGEPVPVVLGDRVQATVGYTVRFRLRPEQLRVVHERFGPDGIFGIVRDESALVLGTALGQAGTGVADVLTEAGATARSAIADRLDQVLAEDGLELTSFMLGGFDLGRTGEVIQAVSRAPHELAYEEAMATVRLAQAQHDAELVAADGDPWRYRETDLWRELIARREILNVGLQSGPRVPGTAGAAPGSDGAPGAVPGLVDEQRGRGSEPRG